MSKYYRFENSHSVQYFIKSLVVSIAMTTSLIATLPLESLINGGEVDDLGLNCNKETTKFNTRTTKSNIDINLRITGIENIRIIGTFNNQPATVNITIEPSNGTCEHISKILSKEYSTCEEILEGAQTNDNISSTFKIRIKHKPKKKVVAQADTGTNHQTNNQRPRVKRVFNDLPIAVGVVAYYGNGTIEHLNKIFLIEDSIYHGILGGVAAATNMGGTLKFGIEYQPRHGALEINEKTGEFFYFTNDPNFSGPDSFGYFVSNDITMPQQKSKYKQIFVSILPITGKEAVTRALKQPLWGYWHYLNCIKNHNS